MSSIKIFLLMTQGFKIILPRETELVT